MKKLLLAALFAFAAHLTAFAQKPILPDFHADPSARVFNGRLYVYPSHDAAGARNWKSMVDWPVFSTDDMVTWTNHGTIFSLKDIAWADTEAWAPDCIERNGKYYFYFPAGGQIGVAVADSPTGPFKDALGKPLVAKGEAGIRYMIDPNIFIDDDGQAYLYVGGAYQLGVVKLKEDMITRDGPIQMMELKNFYEGVWLHKRNGIYYASYPIRPEGREGQANVMAYSIAKTPLGPWEYKGEIIDSRSHNVHGSITQFRGRDYLFYHVEGPSHWERRVCVEPLFYNADGTIKPVTMSPRHTDEPLPIAFFKNLQAGKKQTVVIYGTSLSHTAEWPKALKEYLDAQFSGQITFINSASSGKQSDWGLANLESRVLSKNPDLVFIEFSMNDSATKHNISLEKSAANLDAIVKALRRRNPQVNIVLQTMNPSWDNPADAAGKNASSARPALAQYYQIYRDYAREQGLPLIDHHAAWLALRQQDESRFREWLPDGTHPIPEASLAVTLSAIKTLLAKAAASSSVAASRRLSIAETGALADGATINTASIQSAIDRLAAQGGGTVVVPRGVFVSGALDLKPGVNLHLEKDAVLRATTEMSHFPSRPTRLEGKAVDYTPALINAERCDGLRITGEGTLDGDGRKIWDEFWTRRRAAADQKNFANMAIPRARLAFIANSHDVVIEGVTFKDSQFWNCHLYLCKNVTVRNARFQVPDDYKQAPSTDGIDVDSSQDVLIEGCVFSVTDDCIALKGTKGPFALDDRDSPPVERVRVRDCVFKRGHAAVTFGSEATTVRDVLVENCRVAGAMSALNFKLRPDTPQTYENVHYRDITLDAANGAFISVKPWTQYFDLKGQPPPRSVVRNITISNITGRYGSFGTMVGNPGQTEIEGIVLKDIELRLNNGNLRTSGVKNLRFENVIINGAPASASDASM